MAETTQTHGCSLRNTSEGYRWRAAMANSTGTLSSGQQQNNMYSSLENISSQLKYVVHQQWDYFPNKAKIMCPRSYVSFHSTIKTFRKFGVVFQYTFRTLIQKTESTFQSVWDEGVLGWCVIPPVLHGDDTGKLVGRCTKELSVSVSACPERVNICSTWRFHTPCSPTLTSYDTDHVCVTSLCSLFLPLPVKLTNCTVSGIGALLAMQLGALRVIHGPSHTGFDKVQFASHAQNSTTLSKSYSITYLISDLFRYSNQVPLILTLNKSYVPLMIIYFKKQPLLGFWLYFIFKIVWQRSQRKVYLLA